MRQVLLFLFLLIIFLQLFYVTEGFNNLDNLNFSEIKTVDLNTKNIDTDEPLYCFQNYLQYYYYKNIHQLNCY